MATLTMPQRRGRSRASEGRSGRSRASEGRSGRSRASEGRSGRSRAPDRRKESVTEGTILRWLTEPGGRRLSAPGGAIALDDAIVEVETEPIDEGDIQHVTVEVLCPFASDEESPWPR